MHASSRRAPKKPASATTRIMTPTTTIAIGVMSTPEPVTATNFSKKTKTAMPAPRTAMPTIYEGREKDHDQFEFTPF